MVLYEWYTYIVYDIADPRAFNYILLATPWPILTIISVYLYFVNAWGPRFMKNQEPYKIDWIIKIYNLMQIAWNAGIFYLMLYVISSLKQIEDLSIWCLPLTYSGYNFLPRLEFVTILYLYNKIFDLFDTVFFILRKKSKQVSYIHIYHHVFMIFGIWLGRYGQGGNNISIGVLNSLVHIFMYTYYELALLGFHKWLWWKKYLTLLQIVQFVIIFFHNSAVFFQSSCNYNLGFTIFTMIQSLYFCYLFSVFYIKTYWKKEDKKTK